MMAPATQHHEFIPMYATAEVFIGSGLMLRSAPVPTLGVDA